MSKSQLAERLLAVFTAELEEQVRVMNADLLALEASPGDSACLKSLFRVAHTLKGAARAAGVVPIERACHALENRLANARDGTLTLGPAELTQLFGAADALADAHARLRAGQDLAATPIAALAQRLETDAAVPPPPAPSAAAPQPTTERGSGQTQVRVDAHQLDALLAATGQLMIAGSHIASGPAAWSQLRETAARCATDFSREGRRLRLALERLGAAPRLVQAVRTTEERLRGLARDAARLADAAGRDTHALAHATAEIVAGAEQVRLRPFAEACEALPRVTRDTAAASGKEVQLKLAGGDVQADRAVLDGLREALLHLVRNAVDHGIEPPAERERAGKPRRGTVVVGATLRGDRLTVTVADDGAGLDVPTVRRQLESRGRPAPAEERQLARMLLEGGVSTRSEVTAISGRGVGLDLVRAAAERIRGGVELTWSREGTTVTITCPPSLATMRAVLAEVGSQTLAFPITHVERLLRVRPDDIRHAEGHDVIVTNEAPVRLVALARLLPPLEARPVEGPMAVVVMQARERRLAAAVETLVAEQEVVVRPLAAGGARLPLVSGAALLGTGRVALVLDPVAVIDAGLALATGQGLLRQEGRAARAAKRRILVVDDSITTRTLQQSVLEAAGYDVRAAVDGAEGWRELQEHGADLVVADIEMPRMDGFELCQAIRGSRRFKSLPVVLVTALETPEHRARGLEVGADAYIGKSSFDQQNLLDTIRQLLGSEAT